MVNRFDGKVEPFGVNSQGGERTTFGNTVQSDDIDDNLNADFLRGWGIVGVNDNPTKQDFNAMGYTLGNLIAYLYQQGIPTWNTNQEYFVNSYVIASDGKLYRAKTGASGTPNAGNNPTTDTVNWESLDGKFVDLLNAQTIAGVKTFNQFPITPSSAPTSNYQVANKKYVDDNAGRDVATATEIRTGTDNNKAVTPLGLNDTVLGMSQSWQDVTASRSSGVTYTNTTGRPMQVSVSAFAQSGDIVPVVDGVTLPKIANSNTGSWCLVNFIVPDGDTYKANVVGTIYAWAELR